MGDSSDSNLSHEVQKILSDRDQPAIRKYAMLTVGSDSLVQLALYEMITSVFGAWPGGIGYAFRRTFYRLLFQSMGSNVTIGRNVTFRGMSRIIIGDDACIDDNCVVDARGSQASIAIGDGVFIGRNTIVRNRGESLRIGSGSDIGCHCLIATDSRLEIGDDVIIAAYTYVAAGGSYRTDDKTVPIKRQGFLKKGGSRIENNVWIGAHSMVMDGVTIGSGTVVGAYSFVNHSLPPMTYAWGIPARVQRPR